MSVEQAWVVLGTFAAGLVLGALVGAWFGFVEGRYDATASRRQW